MKYNNGQLNAIDYMSDFIDKNPTKDEDYFMTLVGFAGTGKSTITQAIVNKYKFKKKIVVSAPTHPAKEIIGDITKQNSETIQALLGLRPDVDMDNFNPNKPVFGFKAEQKIKNYNIVLIDESSMLNKSSVTFVREVAVLYKVKVIFIGDKYQLPPVGESISIVFQLPNKVELTEIVRQDKSNPNTELIEMARNDVQFGTDNAYKFLLKNPERINAKGEGYKVFNQSDFYPPLLEKYEDGEYNQNPKLVKTISWTNDSTLKINRYVRNQIIKSTDRIAKGDILRGYKNVTLEVPQPPFYIPVVKNSVDYIVTNVEVVDREVKNKTFKFYRVEVKGQLSRIHILHSDSYDDFIKEIKERHQLATLTRQWKQYYDFKNEIVLIDSIRFGAGTRDVCDKDIDYGYAISVHKSQGSTFTNVGIILKELLYNKTPQERRKLIYVALSRTSKLNYIYL